MTTPRLRVVREDDNGEEALEEFGAPDDREIAALLSDDVVARIMDLLDARRHERLSFRHAEGVFDG